MFMLIVHRCSTFNMQIMSIYKCDNQVSFTSSSNEPPKIKSYLLTYDKAIIIIISDKRKKGLLMVEEIICSKKYQISF